MEFSGLLLDRKIAAPRVWPVVSGDGPPRIEWATGGRHHESPSLAHCLNGFFALADASDREIAAFAEKWGPLRICPRHARPGAPHISAGSRGPRMCYPYGALQRNWEPKTERWDWHKGLIRDFDDPHWNPFADAYWEPLAAWRYYARLLSSVMNAAEQVRNGQIPQIDDVKKILGHRVNRKGSGIRGWRLAGIPATWFFLPVDDDVDVPLDGWSSIIADLVTREMEVGGVRPRLIWDEKGPRLTLDLHGIVATEGQALPPDDRLYGVIISLLAQTIYVPAGWVRCGSCGQWFPPVAGHNARTDRRNFCSPHCSYEGAKKREAEGAKRRYWERKDRQNADPRGIA